MLLICTVCEAKVDAREVASTERLDDGPIRTAFLVCPSCDEPMIARQRALGLVGNEFLYGEAEQIYPVEHIVHPSIPETIRRSMEEALQCLDHRCYVAAAIMCRRTLEAMCKHHGKEKNLAASLKALHDAKVIDERLYEWAEALRADGNLAAHDPEATFSRQDAEDLAEFSEAILEYVFVLSDRFAAFKARRAEAGTPALAPTNNPGPSS